MPFEQRSAPAEVKSNGRRLEGYAALFGSETRILDSRGAVRFREVIMPGAFSNDLNRDILALVDHDPGRLLGRTRTGSLRLASDTRGLHFEVDVPETSLGRDMLALAERGDIGGASFQFDVPAGGETWRDDLRELRSVRLFEISAILAFPAYPGTSVNARSMPAGAPAVSLRRRYLDTLGA